MQVLVGHWLQPDLARLSSVRTSLSEESQPKSVILCGYLEF